MVSRKLQFTARSDESRRLTSLKKPFFFQLFTRKFFHFACTKKSHEKINIFLYLPNNSNEFFVKFRKLKEKNS
jgi:hypothetical protein